MKRLSWILICVLNPILLSAANSPDAQQFEPAAWSPYLVGGLLGVLTWLTFYFSDKPVGASSFYATVAGKIGMMIAPNHTKSLTYFKDNPPKFGWEAVFVLATIAGGFAGAFTGGDFNNQWVPDMWAAKFGSDSLPMRAMAASGGGILMAFGARMAGGCTSGHGISGTLQLNVASWIAVVSFFIGGIIVANIVFRS